MISFRELRHKHIINIHLNTVATNISTHILSKSFQTLSERNQLE